MAAIGPPKQFGDDSFPRSNDTLLLRGETPVLAVWGGIGFTRRPLKELRQFYALHRDDLTGFLKHCNNILRSLAIEKEDGSVESVQQDLFAWVKDATRKPPTLSTAVQYTVTAVLLMARYVVFCKRLGKTPGEAARSFSAFAGHSLGMGIATCMAMADSWASLYDMADLAITGYYCGGLQAAMAWDTGSSVPRSTTSEFVRRGEGNPSAMLSITGIDQGKLVEEMDAVNRTLPPERKLYMALINHVDSFVAGGGSEGLVVLCNRLRSLKPSRSIETQLQPYQCSVQFIPCQYPFHTPHMRSISGAIRQRVAHIKVRRSQALLPVWGMDSLFDEDSSLEDDLGPAIIEQVLWRQVDWPKTLEPMTGRWQVLDFGPGGFNGVGTLIQKMKAGSRSKVYVVCPTDSWTHGNATRGPADLLAVMTTDQNPQRYLHAKFEERPVLKDNQTTPPSKPRFTQVMGLPRVLVAGMTPTTCDVGLVAAVMNAGYYVEFATGGYHDAPSLAAALRDLARKIPEGRLITVNVVYANPQGLSWMIPTMASLIRAGCPIGGLTIGAGVPAPEVAAEYIKTLELSYIGFKPSSVSAIHEVLEIAKSHPTLPVLLQWTGGRAGGHHSMEDFHQPILECHQAILEVNNVLLVGGSGFGDADASWPYLSGEWSQRFGQIPIPFDAILLGTYMMTALEAKSSLESKKAMVEAPGVPDAEWSGTMKQPTGGTISITSHLGEPMHVLATRGMMLWAELENSLFKQPKDKMAQTLSSRKEYLISRLNDDYQKVWFGFDYGSNKPVDLADMTYFDVLRRLLELLHPARKGDWTDPSYRVIFVDFLTRTLERFGIKTESIRTAAQEQLHALAVQHPEFNCQFLSVEDNDYFVSLCKRRGQKPVPFIPVLDAEFPVWFKKDPLWQSENLESTYHDDVGRVCILCGPVALQYCKEFNKPVEAMLDAINQGYLEKEKELGLGATLFTRDASSPCFYEEAELVRAIGASYVISEGQTIRLAEDSPESLDNEQWLLLLGCRLGLWGQRVFGQRKLVANGRAYENPIRKIFAAMPGVMVRFLGKKGRGYSAAEFYADAAQPLLVDARVSIEGNTITAVLVSRCTRDTKPLEYTFNFKYDESHTHAPIIEMTDDRTSRIVEFYRSHIFGTSGEPVAPRSLVITHPPLLIEKEEFISWQRAVDGHGLDVLDHMGPAGEVPIEYTAIQVMYVNWRHLFTMDWDVSKLLHQYTMVRMREGQRMLSIGDELYPVSRVTALRNRDSGIEVRLHMIVERRGVPAIDLIYRFMLLGQRVPDSECFEHGDPATWEVNLRTEAGVQALLAKPWLRPSLDSEAFAVGKALRFEIRRDMLQERGVMITKVSGQVWLHDPERKGKEDMIPVGLVEEVVNNNGAGLCTTYMRKHGVSCGEPVRLQSERKLKPKTSGQSFKIITPANSADYAIVSGDINPIHTSLSVARFAGFKAPIYHGNQTAALVLQLIRREVPGASSATLRQYECTFSAVVLPGDTLSVELKHVAMDEGGSVISLSVRRDLSDELVLVGEVFLEAPATAFMFTGQGSQFAGMGLDMISQSRPSRLVWAEADDYFEQHWGFSVSSVVKRNPTKLTVNFCGRQGMFVRQNYLDAQAMLDSCSSTREMELFNGLHSGSRSYTFHHEDGLLSMTQFAQPAIFVMEKAAFEYLQELGRVAPGSRFAGHSLGEFAALGCMTSIFPARAALRTVFIRGALMQAAVQRDANGRSGFAMVAVDPTRISKESTERHILLAVAEIAKHTGLLLEMVNFNVQGHQYVCAGDKRCLDLLRKVTDELHHNPSRLDQESIRQLVVQHAQDMPASANDMVLSRGKATVPLNGIDVPFHSSLLAPMREHFRRTLTQGISKDEVKPEALVGTWIPNVTGKPFALDAEYLKLVAGLEGAGRIKALAAELQLLGEV
ncbi:acyl transferase domain-containing protein [Ilyonectria destructans]|nr:acyl transferase domain-containing protein [Ilyonectria destructans]